MYSLFVEKTPGDDVVTPTYYADGFALLDYMPILPNQNQYTDKKFNNDLIVMEVIIVVRYIISRIVPADGAVSTSIQNFHKATLKNLDAVFHVDEDQYLTQQVGLTGSVSPGRTMIRQLEDYGYPYVGIRNKKNLLLLCNYDVDKNPGPPVEMKSLEDDNNLRLVLPGLHIKDAGADILTSEFGYDRGVRAWVLFDGNQPRVVGPDLAVHTSSSVVSASTPVHVFTVVRCQQPGLLAAREGLIRNYGGGLTYAVTWNQIAQGLSVVLKVLPLVIQIGSLLFG